MARIVLTDYKKSFKKLDGSIENPHCAGLIQAIQNDLNGSMSQMKSYTGTIKVRNSLDIKEGTVIATLLDGKYPNESSGNHVAIYVSKSDAGITVFHQWKGKAAHEATIRYKGGKSARDKDKKLQMSNDGDFYYIVEV